MVFSGNAERFIKYSELDILSKYNNMVKNKGILLRESEDKINIIKKLANREGKTISEFIRNRVFIEPIVLEKLNEILSEVKNAKLTN